MKHFFIVNPVAGKGKPLRYIPEIESIFRNRKDEHVVRLTEKPGHATTIAREYAHTDDSRIYSVGGDGTLNEIVNGIACGKSSLAVIPGGSGNDFIKSISNNWNTADILKRTIEGREKPVDLANVNGRYFINIASVGLDGDVAHYTNKHKRLTGLKGVPAYLLGVAEALFKYKNNLLRIKIDEKYLEMKSLLVAVANGKFYGGGMMPTPEALVDDSRFDICLVGEKGRFSILKFLPKFIKGRHGGIEGVYFFRGKKVEIQCDSEISLNIDGEVRMVKQALFDIIPGGINVVIPI